ncbi:MAG: (d)CMP kinase [Pseudomonadota bacterium]
MIIAVDGPAASGKGTLSKRLASHYRLQYLDTGLLYRAVGALVLASGGDLDDVETAVSAARALDLDHLDPDPLRGAGTGEAASRVAALPDVRQSLLELQRAFATRAPGAVLDGRDIGTVICPDANAKLFVTATPETRADRRYKELTGRGESADFDTVLADIHKRDARDMGRAIAPLRPAEDAHLLDTTEMDIDTAFRNAVRLIEASLSEA